jgi:hypothetical protein
MTALVSTVAFLDKRTGLWPAEQRRKDRFIGFPWYRFLDKSIARLPYAEEKQYKVRDTELTGFFVLIGKRMKSFMAQDEFGGMASANSPPS